MGYEGWEFMLVSGFLLKKQFFVSNIPQINKSFQLISALENTTVSAPWVPVFRPSCYSQDFNDLQVLVPRSSSIT